MAIESYYVPVVIQRKTVADNGFGGQTETWTTHLTVQGFIDWISDSGIDAAGQRQTILRPIMMTKTGQDIKQYDRAVWDGTTYNITNKPDNVMSRNHHLEFMLEVVTGG